MYVGLISLWLRQKERSPGRVLGRFPPWWGMWWNLPSPFLLLCIVAQGIFFLNVWGYWSSLATTEKAKTCWEDILELWCGCGWTAEETLPLSYGDSVSNHPEPSYPTLMDQRGKVGTKSTDEGGGIFSRHLYVPNLEHLGLRREEGWQLLTVDYLRTHW